MFLLLWINGEVNGDGGPAILEWGSIDWSGWTQKSEQIISQGVLWRQPIVSEMKREFPPLATWLVPFHFPHCQLACPGVKNSLTEVTSTKHLDSTTSLLFTRFRRFKSDLAFTPKGRKPHLRASQEQSKEQTDSTWAILIIVTRSGIASTLFSFATCY